MIKKTIKYKTLNGEDREKDFYFHLSKSTIIEQEMIHPGGFREHLQTIIDSKNGKTIITEFKNLVRMSYGRKSEDEESFIQSDELSDWFMGTDAYTEFFLQLCTDAAYAAEFVNGIFPQDAADRFKKLAEQAGLQIEASDVQDDKTGAAAKVMSDDELQAVMQQIREGKLQVTPS